MIKKNFLLKLLSYPRSVLMVFIYPIYLLLVSMVTITVSVIFNRREFDDSVLKWWGRVSCKMFGVRVQVQGLENIPWGGGVYVFNHTSFFDIFAMAGHLPSVRFGAKIELFNIPFFGWAMQRLGVLPIARNKRDEVFKIYKEAERRLQAGEHIALAPEGTRQKEEKLGKFKAGPFIFAINAKVPVIPIAIRNASSILPKHSIFPNFGTWSRNIELIILPAFDTKTLNVTDRPSLQEQVMASMQPYFTTLQEEVGIL